MKQKLKEEIEASQKGIDYVDSFVPNTPTRNSNITEEDIDNWIKENASSDIKNVFEWFYWTLIVPIFIVCFLFLLGTLIFS